MPLTTTGPQQLASPLSYTRRSPAAHAHSILFLFACLVYSAPARPNSVEIASKAELLNAVRSASPGDVILMAPGGYEGGCMIQDVKGAPGALVRIAAKDPADPPLFSGGKEAFHINRCSYLILDGLIATGATINNVQVGFSDHIILKNLHSKKIGGQSNCDGIKMPNVTDFLLYSCEVETWGGEGSAIDMVGCARGLIMKSRFAYPGLSGRTANCIQPKGGTHSMGFYKCRFDDASLRAVQFGGATGKQYFFQQNFDSGYEGLDMAAMGNVITGGGAAVVFVSCTRCEARYNTIVNPGKFVMRLLKEGGSKPTASNAFSNNLIVYGKIIEVLNRGGDIDLASFTFDSNYWYNTLNPKQSVPNLPVTQRNPAGGGDPRLDEHFGPDPQGPASQYGANAPGLAPEWLKHTAKFKWAWERAVEFDAEAARLAKPPARTPSAVEPAAGNAEAASPELEEARRFFQARDYERALEAALKAGQSESAVSLARAASSALKMRKWLIDHPGKIVGGRIILKVMGARVRGGIVGVTDEGVTGKAMYTQVVVKWSDITESRLYSLARLCSSDAQEDAQTRLDFCEAAGLEDEAQKERKLLGH